jgi:hypothetical protein
LIVTIDPGQPKLLHPDDEEWDAWRNFCSAIDMQRFAEQRFGNALAFLAADPTYDVAKLFLSTGVGYSLVGRLAFEPARDARGVWILKQPKDNVFLRFSDRGGLSGAQIVALDERTHKNVLDYHTTASEAVLNEHLNLMRKRECTDPLSRNSALVQLWFLMMRHGFSIAEKLFLEDASKSLVQLVLLTLALNGGESIIREAINNLDSDNTTQNFYRALH